MSLILMGAGRIYETKSQKPSPYAYSSGKYATSICSFTLHWESTASTVLETR